MNAQPKSKDTVLRQELANAQHILERMLAPKLTVRAVSYGVWCVQSPDEIHDVAVYCYRGNVWRCESHRGRATCQHIEAVKGV